jgi:DNA recombination protein RmuC
MFLLLILLLVIATASAVLQIYAWRSLQRLLVMPLDLSPVQRKADLLIQLVEQGDRGFRDEFSRFKQEFASQHHALREDLVGSVKSMGDSVFQQVTALAAGNELRLDQFRKGVEQRLDAFGGENNQKLDLFRNSLSESGNRLQGQISDELQRIQAALAFTAQKSREDTSCALKGLSESVVKSVVELNATQTIQLGDIRNTVDSKLTIINAENEKRLEQMRQTVDEKLQSTLESRLGESFKLVSERLEQVHKGLGEMHALASGVGDLKRVLTNVKTRGTWGEVQLGSLLEQMLTPEQFEKNVNTTGTQERVEFAIKLPGMESGKTCWLPIDAKFPVEDYQRLVEASEQGDPQAVEVASRKLEATLKLCAKKISEKYLLPPATTDFGILFLPTEGLYAEALRRVGLAESLQREHRVVLTGPNTFAAILNSLQMGFRTLAIQHRSSEVWETLAAVKTEFGKYADVLAKVKRKLLEASHTVDQAEVRTRALQRHLREVESTSSDSQTCLEVLGVAIDAEEEFSAVQLPESALALPLLEGLG